MRLVCILHAQKRTFLTPNLTAHIVMHSEILNSPEDDDIDMAGMPVDSHHAKSCLHTVWVPYDEQVLRMKSDTY